MLRITLDIWFTTLSIALWPSYDFQEEIKYEFFPGDSDGKESACNVGDLGLIPELGRSPGEGNSYPPVFLPGEFNGQRSLAGYRPWGCKQSDVTKWLTLSLLCAKLTSLTFLFLKIRLCISWVSRPYFIFDPPNLIQYLGQGIHSKCCWKQKERKKENSKAENILGYEKNPPSTFWILITSLKLTIHYQEWRSFSFSLTDK